jgi:hypothetical protein
MARKTASSPESPVGDAGAESAASGKRWLRAATGTVNLAVLGAAGVGALVTGWLPLLAVGAATYGALVSWDLLASRAGRSVQNGDGRLASPDALALRDPGVRTAMTALKQARAELDRVLAETPDTVRQTLGPALASVDDIERSAVTLAKRADDLSTYLRGQDPRPLLEDVRRLQELARRARDPQARTEYERALQARNEQLQALEDIRAARERIVANLSGLVASLDALSPKLVRMRAMDDESMDALGGDVSQDLDRLNGEVKLFEKTLESIGKGEF